MADTNGKIGSCYSFDGSDDYISLVGSELFNCFTGNTKEFSIAVWIYHADATRAIIFGDYSTSGAINFNIELDASHRLRFYWDGAPSTYPANATVIANTWTHAVFTYNGTKIQSYINGEAKGSWSGTLGVKNKTNGEFRLGRDNRTGSTTLNGKLNDFRIYDHCLSAAEVKEISQGLVLHYKLDGFQGGFGNPNLVAGSNTSSTSTNKWGASSSVGGNTSTIVQDENGHTCVQVARDATAQSSWDYLYYSNLLKTLIKPNTTYTVSFDCKPSVDGSIGFTGFLNGNATNSMMASTSTIQGTCYANQWNHMIYRGITKASFDDISVSGQVVYFSRSGSLRGVNTTVLFKNIKVEEGTVDTPWCPADSELTIDRTHIQDSSGYGHNGSIIGTPTLSSNTARYSSSMQFNGSNQAINAYRGAMVTDAITASCWAYMPTWTASSKTLMSCVESQGWGLKPTGNSLRFVIVVNNSSNTTLNATSSKTYASLSAGWHMFTGTCDGTVAKFYIDGELEATSSTITKGVIQYNSGNSLFIGAEASGSASTPAGDYFAGNISDARIYATALSQADIKQLYNTAAKVDNLGGLHTFEFQEKGPNKIYKAGITQGQEISEIDGMSNLKYDPNVYIEPDGSAWVRIFHHVNPTSNKFASSDTFTTGVYKDVNRWFNFDLCNYVNSWEFIAAVTRTNTDTLERYRWIQSTNPLTATFDQTKVANVTRITTGYNTSPLGGLYHVSGSSWLAANNGTNNNWFGATGCWSAWNGGIPGWKSTAAGDAVTTGTIDIYLRIDNITTTMPTIAKSTKNNIWLGHNLIER